jgi:MFS family permease
MVPRRLIVTSSLVAFSLLGDSMLYAVLPSEAVRLGLSAAAIGWILSLNRWVRLLTNPIAARVCARWGWRWPFLAAVVVGAGTTVAYGIFGGALWPLLAARALWGFSWSFLRQGGYSAVMEGSTSQTRGRAMGFFVGIFRVGSLAGMLAGGFLADRVGYEQTLVLFGIISGLGVLTAGLDNWLADGRGNDLPRAADGPGEGAGSRAVLFSPRRFLRSRPWLNVSAGGFVNHFITSGLITATLGHFLLYRFSGLAQVATVTGFLLSLRWIGGFALNPLMGVASDRIGRAPTLAGGAALGALGMAAVAGAPSVLVVAAGVMAVWVAETAVSVSFDAAAGDLAALDGGAEALGYYATVLDLGAASGPLLGYYLVELGLPLQAVYLAGAAGYLAAPLLYRVTQRAA